MRNKLIMKYPASYHRDMWRGGVPVGNGRVGALIYGGVYHEILAVNHTNLWTNPGEISVPDVSDSLQAMRELISEGKYIEAERIMVDKLRSEGYLHETPVPIPLGDLNVFTENEKAFTNYRRILDMESGTAEVSWLDGDCKCTRKVFVSRNSDTVCVKLTQEKALKHMITFGMHDAETINDAQAPEKAETTVEGNYIKYAASYKNNADYGAVVYVKTENSLTQCEDSITVYGSGDVDIFIKLFTDDSREKKWNELMNALAKVENYDNELINHAKMHSKLFNAVKFDIGGSDYHKSNEEIIIENYQGKMSNEFVEKMWSFGRYLLISATDANTYPCHLYGLWCGYYNPMWAFNMFNVNLEMIYWQAYSGGLLYSLIALFNHIEEHMDEYRENARKLFNCRGINIPSIFTPPTGLYTCVHPHIVHWTGAAGWAAQLYYDYYLFTRDLDFLKNRALPFMYEAILFYEDYITYNNDEIQFVPSNSPENTPENIKKIVKNREMEVVINATMDFAILKELLTNLIQGCSIVGMYSEKVDMWKELLNKIPEYQINERGAIREWMHGDLTDNNAHRHLSHTYPLFPGTEITREHKLFKAFKETVNQRKTVGLRSQTGWSLTYMANLRARMGDGNEANECLNLLSRSTVLDNFITVHNDWRRMGIAMCDDFREAPVQIDANMGFTAAVQEMLVTSTKNDIYIFNAIPDTWEKGSAGPLKTRTNSNISMAWNNKKKEATVHIVQGNTNEKMRLILPQNMLFKNGTDTMALDLKAGTEYNIMIDIE